jgi:dihydropteroate synthase
VTLLLRGRRLELAEPVLMGIVNAGPDSFSDPGARGLDELVRVAHGMAEAGAALIDVGGESGRTDREPVPEDEEIQRVAPLVERLAADGLSVSVDTWRAPVARAALAAGAEMINDVSGLTDPGVAEACAETGAALVITHTRLPPKVKGFPEYDDVVADVAELLRERCAQARELGVEEDRLVLDPGIDLAKTPAESVEVLRRLPELAALGRPLLVAVSRKDFVGALTERAPSGRLPGTLAAVGAAADGGAKILRVHDVAAAADYLRVHRALDGGGPVDPGLRLSDELRREPHA